MIHDSLVAINLIDITTNTLQNKSSVPLLYYWNGENDVLEDLRNDDDLANYCKMLFINPEKYLNIMISYFYFKFDDDRQENYHETTDEFQNIVYLNKFDSEHIVKHYILYHLKNLYKISLKEEYTNDETSFENTVIDIYTILQDKFKTRISKPTIINWVRSVLLDTSHFNSTNTDYIINYLSKTLENIN